MSLEWWKNDGVQRYAWDYRWREHQKTNELSSSRLKTHDQSMLWMYCYVMRYGMLWARYMMKTKYLIEFFQKCLRSKIIHFCWKPFNINGGFAVLNVYSVKLAKKKTFMTQSSVPLKWTLNKMDFFIKILSCKFQMKDERWFSLKLITVTCVNNWFLCCVHRKWMVIRRIGHHVGGYYIIIDDAVCFDSAVEWMRMRVGKSEGEWMRQGESG